MINTVKIILEILDSSDKKKIYFLLFLIFIMAFMDVLGIASILPFIGVVANPEIIQTNLTLNNFYNALMIFGISNQKQFILVLGLITLFLLILSITLRAITNHLMMKFSALLEYRLGEQLVRGYLYQPYTWFLQQHSANLSKNILTEVGIVVQKTIFPILNIFAYGSIVLSILVFLCFVDIKLAFNFGVILITAYLIVYYLVKKKLTSFGKIRLKANESKFKSISEAFGAIKEIKLLEIEDIYVKNFSSPALRYALTDSSSNLIAILPRFLIELLSFGAMIIVILIWIFQNKQIENILPLIALYTIAGYRLIPSLQQVYFAVTRMRYSQPSLMAVHKNIKNFRYLKKSDNSSNLAPIKFEKYIQVNKVSYCYPNSTNKIIDNIQLLINANSTIGIVGATGSGKSTFIDIVSGLIEPDEGEINVDGKVINNNNINLWKKNIGFVPQEIFLINETIKDNITFGINKDEIDIDEVKDACKIAKIHDYISNLPDGYFSKIGEGGIKLSGGERQRIGIARAIFRKPKILILDEATSALDNHTENILIEDLLLMRKNLTLIIVAHRLNTIKKCDTIFLLDKGKLIGQGNYSELRESSKLFLKNKNFNQ